MTPVLKKDRSRAQAYLKLLPRVVRSKVGGEKEVLNMTLLNSTAGLPAMTTMWSVEDRVQEKLAVLLVTKLECLKMINAHERDSGFRYNVYARVRLDTMVLQ